MKPVHLGILFQWQFQSHILEGWSTQAWILPVFFLPTSILYFSFLPSCCKKTMSFFSTSKLLHLGFIPSPLTSPRTLYHQLTALVLTTDSFQYAFKDTWIQFGKKTKSLHVSLPPSPNYFSISIRLFIAVNFPAPSLLLLWHISHSF